MDGKSADPLAGVLEHLETKGGGFLPLPLALGALPGHPPNINPFEPNGPSLDSFGLNGSYSNKNHATQAKVNFGPTGILARLLPKTVPKWISKDI